MTKVTLKRFGGRPYRVPSPSALQATAGARQGAPAGTRPGRLVRELCRAEGGSALIELTMLLPLLLFIVLVGIEFGMYIQRSILVLEAASVGARYGIIAGNASNTAGMIQAATAESEGLSSFKATATTFCSCSPGGSKVDCATTCSTGYKASHYVQVTTNANVPGIFNFQGYAPTMHPTATSTMRASWPGQ